MNRQAVISLESPLAGRFVNDIPEPTNDVAVTTPTALIPPARTLIPVLAVISPTESILVTSSYVRVPPTDTLPVNVAATPVILPLNCVALATPVTLTPEENVGAPVPALLVKLSALTLPPPPANTPGT